MGAKLPRGNCVESGEKLRAVGWILRLGIDVSPSLRLGCTIVAQIGLSHQPQPFSG